MSKIERKEITVGLTFTEPLLATASGNPELQRDFISAKAATQEQMDEELSTLPVEEQIEKASTVFQRDEKGLFVFDYTVKGHFKEVIGNFCDLGRFQKLSKWTYKGTVDGCLFVLPRRIYLERDGSILKKPDGTLERPLRATTMQGDRVALARSEFAKEGTQIQFKVVLMVSTNSKSYWKELNMEVITEVLDLGVLHGTGQWRNGGYGRYTWNEVK